MENLESSAVQTNTPVNPIAPVQTPSPQQTPIQPNLQRNYWKFAVITLVVLVLGLAGGLVYVLQKQATSQSFVSQITPTSLPSPTSTMMVDETANWKEYNNTSSFYTLKYPNNWILNETAAAGEGGCMGPTFYTSSAKKNWLTICSLHDPTGDGLANNEKTNQKAPYINFEKVTINGISAFKSELHQFDSQYEYNTYVEGRRIPGEILWFHLISEIPEKESNKKIYNQILSTLKFTDQSQNTTSDWKSFKGKVYSFDYPSNFVVKEDQTTGSNVTVSLNSNEYLHIFNIETLTYENFFECGKGADTGCLQKISDTQTDLIEDILVDGKKAKSFYVYGGPDSLTHVVEIIQPPTTQLRMSIAGGGLEKTFDQILSTFKFTK